MLRQPRPLVPFTFPKRAFLVYLLDDEFTTALSAGSVNGTAAEPGPGTRTVADTGNFASIAGGALVMNGFTGLANPRLMYGGLTRVSGLALRMHMNWGASKKGCAGFNNGAVPGGGGQIGLRDGSLEDLGNVVPGINFTAGVDYDHAFVARSTGSFHFLNVSGTWMLQWVSLLGTSASLFPGYWALTTNCQMTSNFMRVMQLYSPFDSDYGIAMVHTSAVSGSDYAAAADLIADVVITAPGTLANTAGLKFRKNGTDYWKIWFNSSGALQVQRFVADVGQGSPVTLGSSVISASGTLTLRVIASGASMDFWTLNGSTWSKRGSTQTDSNFTTQTGINPFADSGWSLGQLDSYPLTSSSYSILNSISG